MSVRAALDRTPATSGPVVPASAGQAAAAPWPVVRRLGFRWLFCYLTLYMLQPSPLDWLAPGLIEPYSALWRRVVGAAGGALGLDVSVLPNRSGDTTYNHVQVLCYAVLAALVAAAWTLLSRRREHERLRDWLRAAVRVYLSLFMLLYGAAKVVPMQFAAPSLTTLSLPLGELTPNALLWATLGFSPLYVAFTGSVEMLAGLLLISRRTSAAGSLLATAVMANVLMLNVSYDVVVKLFSLHLLLMAAWLAAPEAARLFDLLVRNRAVPARELRPLVRTPAAHRRLVVARTALLVLFATLVVARSAAVGKQLRAEAARTPFRGVWVAAGAAAAPGAASAAGVLRLVVDGRNEAAVQLADGRWRRFQWWPDGRTVELFERGAAGPPVPVFTIRRLDAERVELTGRPGSATAIVLRRTEPEFPLLRRGFHWINEGPAV